MNVLMSSFRNLNHTNLRPKLKLRLSFCFLQIQENLAVKKLQAIKKDQFARVKGLEAAQNMNLQKATLIEQHRELIETAIERLRVETERGTDWTVLFDQLKKEGAEGDASSEIIVGLKLDKRKFTVLLE